MVFNGKAWFGGENGTNGILVSVDSSAAVTTRTIATSTKVHSLAVAFGKLYYTWTDSSASVFLGSLDSAGAFVDAVDDITLYGTKLLKYKSNLLLLDGDQVYQSAGETVTTWNGTAEQAGSAGHPGYNSGGYFVKV